MRCHCVLPTHALRFIAITGGPGAGKTALLEVIRRHFCQHVVVVPEAAGIVYGGGFPRRRDERARRAAQRVMYHVQSELERLVTDEAKAAVALCDRGTLDGLAYWPGAPADFFADLATTRSRELARYAAVIHLRVPPPHEFNHDNPLRIESPEEARAIDERIVSAWDGHPRRHFVDSANDFLTKMTSAVELVRAEVPPCCVADGD